MISEKPVIALVIPCYNEEECLSHTSRQIETLLKGMYDRGLVSENSFIFFVDDGSTDGTWNIISALNQKKSIYRGCKLAGNVGHQNALLAGMIELSSEVDCIISLDADLQDNIKVIPEMINKFTQGYHIVYGVRNNRSSDTFFKKMTASFFYKTMNKLKVKLVPQHADFRLVSRTVIEALSMYSESNLFLRGIFPIIGFSSTTVEYERKEREYGDSKYPLNKMLSFAWQGITSFSSLPLRFAAFMSLLSLGAVFVLGVKALFDWYLGTTIKGWASIMITILFFGGLQLLCLAIIGEYIAKIYAEVKKRPRYIVEKLI